MQFTKKLREPIRCGEVTTSIRIWKYAHVKVDGRYRMDEGQIVVTSIIEIEFDDISEQMAKSSGFLNRLDLLKTAKHGSGSIIYFIRFYYESLD